MPSKKRTTPVSLQPLDALFGTNEESINGISEIAIGSLHPFPNHPFQVRDDKKMDELSESIIQYGILVPGIVRLRESGGYELVAGHRRKRASVFDLKNIFYWHFQVLCQPDRNLKGGIAFSTFNAAYSLAAGTDGFCQICLNEISFFTNVF